MEEEPRCFDCTLPQKQYYETHWKRNQETVNCIKMSRTQDLGLRFWQTQPFAIIIYTTVPGDGIDRVTSQSGDRLIFERLATPRLSPKVTLNSYWQIQQQHQQQPQQPTLEDDIPSIWKQRATWQSRAGKRDDTKHAMEVERAYRKLVPATLKWKPILISLEKKLPLLRIQKRLNESKYRVAGSPWPLKIRAPFLTALWASGFHFTKNCRIK